MPLRHVLKKGNKGRFDVAELVGRLTFILVSCLKRGALAPGRGP